MTAEIAQTLASIIDFNLDKVADLLIVLLLLYDQTGQKYFFNNNIAETVSNNKQPQNLISWVKQCKLFIVVVICF